MENNYTKQCLASLVIKQMQTKITRYHYMHILIVKVKKNLIMTKASKDLEQWDLIYCWWKCKRVQPL